ncbi:MAG: NADP-specific glutamate dehydrogenase [Desulfohalobiaceae bacterium]|nr:NADP-specific glutamate dehydrogenase [Desulfohalobiaceae bacterium]
MREFIRKIEHRDPGEKEFHHGVARFLRSIEPVLDQPPEFDRYAILHRLVEPERTIIFQVPWMDDQGQVQVNRGYRVEMNSSVGPYKGGLRFHPDAGLGTFKLLAFEQVFTNSLTTMPLGGARGGSDFDPKGKSDDEVMRFCQSFMSELARHIGPDIDIPEGGLGVGLREIGFLFGAYRKQQNEFSGVMTGKGLGWGGSQIRMQAAGYGVAYFTAEMLAARGDSLDGKRCLISGSGNVALAAAEKITRLGGRVLTLSDSGGHIFDPEGIDLDKLAFVKRLKHIRRGRISEYVEKYSEAEYTEADSADGYNPLWARPADCAFPCAMENEVNAADAGNLAGNNIRLVCEGADMPVTAEAFDVLQDSRVPFAPGKAASAGGVAVSCFEMAQNRMLLNWTAEEVDQRLQKTMKNIHTQCRETAGEFGEPDNYFLGANISAFQRVAQAMQDQGV